MILYSCNTNVLSLLLILYIIEAIVKNINFYWLYQMVINSNVNEKTSFKLPRYFVEYEKEIYGFDR